jgi:hypothetical protein
MKGFFWNCDGFTDRIKHRFILDLTKEQNLSFIAISEIVRRSFTEPFQGIYVEGDILFGI